MSTVFMACLNYNNETRKRSMTERFKLLGINDNVKFFDGVPHDDERFHNVVNKRAGSIICGHLEMLEDFYFNSDSSFAIIFEDDVLIDVHFPEKINAICRDFGYMDLEIMVFGYMINHDPGLSLVKWPKRNGLSDNNYHWYPPNLRGTQCYMISRAYAQRLLLHAKPWYHKPDVDFVITLQANKNVVLFPPLAIDNNKTTYSDWEEQQFHDSCFRFSHTDAFM